jgi:pyruvate-formate lyase-activating enzyme
VLTPHAYAATPSLRRFLEATTVSTDQKGTRILARTFFNQLRASGYTPHQVIGIATELLDLVTTDLKEGDKAVAVQATQEQGSEWRQRA